MSDCLQMPWSIEDTINHLNCIRDSLIRQLRKANFEGKAEQDVTELNYDFERAIKALQENPQYRQIGTLENCQKFDALYLEKCQEVNALKARSQWIPVTWHETTEDDEMDMQKYPICLDCPMPEEDQEILVCDKNGNV